MSNEWEKRGKASLFFKKTNLFPHLSEQPKVFIVCVNEQYWGDEEEKKQMYILIHRNYVHTDDTTITAQHKHDATFLKMLLKNSLMFHF